ncbi:MAG TPA: arginine repressor [Firmicutes bacterium]|nr:arginine repressor [Bacillota bacterium]
MNNYTKEKRLKLIEEFLKRKEIRNQEELVTLLKRRGFKVTQATVARDLKELGAVKVKKGGRCFYKIPDEDSEKLLTKLKVSFNNFVKDIKHTDNLILIKTTPGSATGIARLIDEYDIKGVLGTIAGDDTILAVSEKSKVNKVLKVLKKLRGEK